jgi:hypothetical protein
MMLTESEVQALKDMKPVPMTGVPTSGPPGSADYRLQPVRDGLIYAVPYDGFRAAEQAHRSRIQDDLKGLGFSFIV